MTLRTDRKLCVAYFWPVRLHKEGTPTLLISLAVLCFALFGLWRCDQLPAFLQISITAVLLVLFILIVRFFRDPRVIAAKQDSAVLAPADGKVVVIEKVHEPEYFKDERLQISIFMSPLNVHINYYPMRGVVKYFKYHPGKYLVAWHPKSSTLNERTTVVIDHPQHGEILVRQIAGAVARRICSYCDVDSAVEQGAQFGFIKFGSRLDVYLPTTAHVQVSLDQLTKGATTVLAKFE